jgi:hypothetical protein
MKTSDYLGFGLAAIGFIVGLWQYRQTSRDQFLAPIRQAQIDLYRQASSAASRVATLPANGTDWNQAKDEFLMLYYGPLAIVEDFDHDVPSDKDEITVEKAMITFKTCLEDSGCAGSDMIRVFSLGLAHTLRISLGATWGFQAPQLDGKYQKAFEAYPGR